MATYLSDASLAVACVVQFISLPIKEPILRAFGITQNSYAERYIPSAVGGMFLFGVLIVAAGCIAMSLHQLLSGTLILAVCAFCIAVVDFLVTDRKVNSPQRVAAGVSTANALVALNMASAGDALGPFVGIWLSILPIYVVSGGIAFDLFKAWFSWRSFLRIIATSGTALFFACGLNGANPLDDPVRLGELTLLISLILELAASLSSKNRQRWLSVVSVAHIFAVSIGVGGFYLASTASLDGLQSTQSVSFFALIWIVLIKACLLRWIRWADFSACCSDAFLSTAAQCSWLLFDPRVSGGTLVDKLFGAVSAPSSAAGLVLIQALTLILARGRSPWLALHAALSETYFGWPSLVVLTLNAFIVKVKWFCSATTCGDSFLAPKELGEQARKALSSGKNNEAEALFIREIATYWRYRLIPDEEQLAAMSWLIKLLIDKRNTDMATRVYLWAKKIQDDLLSLDCEIPALVAALEKQKVALMGVDSSAFYSNGLFDIPDKSVTDMLVRSLEMESSAQIQRLAPLKICCLMMVPMGIIYSIHTSALAEAAGASEQADTLFNQSLAIKRLILGDEHAEVASSMERYADRLAEAGRTDKARDLYRAALVDMMASPCENSETALRFGSLYDKLNLHRAAQHSFESGWRRFPDGLCGQWGTGDDLLAEWHSAFSQCAIEEAWQKFAYSNKDDGVWDYRLWQSQSRRGANDCESVVYCADAHLPLGHPTRKRLHLLLADYYDRRGLFDSALEQYKAVLQCEPTDCSGRIDDLTDYACQDIRKIAPKLTDGSSELEKLDSWYQLHNAMRLFRRH